MAIGGDGNGSGPSSSYSGQPLASTKSTRVVEEVLRTGGGDGKTIIIAIVQQGNGAVEDVRRVEIRSLEDNILAGGERNDFPKEKALQLKFFGEVPDTVRTGTVLTSKTGECLKLVLVDSETGEIVDGAPESSAEVEIVVLDGKNDMTRENFERRIIKTGEKKKPHFVKRVYINLKEGVGYLRDVKLGQESDWTKKCKCRLGARVGQSLYAWTQPFEIIDKRDKDNEKHFPPKLSSEVWRLVRICRDGKPCKRLTGKNIETLGDFLFWFHVNRQGLKRILLDGGSGDSKWKAIVDHAETCTTDDQRMHYDDDPRMYCHKSPNEPQTSVIYNFVGKLKGVIQESHFVPVDNLSAHEKKDAYELLSSVLKSAFIERHNTPFDIETSLIPYGSSREVNASSLQPSEYVYQATEQGSSSQSIDPNTVCDSVSSHSRASEEMGELCNPADLDHEKHETPSLFDQVSCLVNICKGGEIHKSLQEIRSLEDNILAGGERNDFPKEKALQLKFFGEVPDTVRTGTVLTSKTGECLKLVLVDSETGEIVDGAPESSAEVEIVVLLDGKNDMTREYFERRIIKTGEKKKPHFVKRVYINLKEGVGYLRDVKLGQESDWTKKCKCRLGARVGQSLYAWTQPFEVIDNREKHKEKNHPPKFSSEVWRLDRIGKGSEPCMRLNGKDIKTVSDFLFWFHVNAQELKQILHRGDGHWKVIVDHAKTCVTDDDPRMHYDDDPRMYSYKSPNEPQTSVVYNFVGKLKGVIKESQFVPIDNLSAHEKDHAYELLGSVLEVSAFKERYNTPFNVEASLPYSSSHEVIASTSSSLQPLCQNIYQATKKRGSSSQTIYPNHVPYSMPSHSHVSEEMGELCNPATLAERHHNMFVFKRVKFNPQVPRFSELCPDHEKNETPSLFDQVSCLVNICKDGEIHKSLQANRINTVEEFLIRLLINKEEIRQMVSLEREEWEATVSNAARACMTGNGTYCYMNLNLRKGVVFNLLGDVLGLLSFDKHFCPANMLSEHGKGEARKLLASALKNWTDVEPYNELDHLHYQLSSSPGSNFVEHQNEPFDGAVQEFCDGFLSTSPKKIFHTPFRKDQAYRGLNMGDQLLKITEEELESEKIKIIATVEERFESLKRKMSAVIKSKFCGENQASVQSTMKLEFRNRIARKIRTSKEIKGEGSNPMEVALVEDVSGVIVVDEPESSAKVEFLLLKGNSDASEGDNWTHEDFKSNIVPQVEGKLPLLDGSVAFRLKKGVGVMKDVRIRNHAIKIKPPKFKLGARLLDAPRVKEATTEPFNLQEYRVQYKEKHQNPSLFDEVWRLASIWKDGEIHKRLQEKNINTVEDFLIQLLVNPQGLMTIAKAQAKKWKATVESARACLFGERVYCYIDPKEKRGVVFNILGDIVGTCSGSFYSHTSTLSQDQKADAGKLLESAYRNWEQEVKAFDNEESLQLHLNGLTTHKEQNSEMVGESDGFGLLSGLSFDIDSAM